MNIKLQIGLTALVFTTFNLFSQCIKTPEGIKLDKGGRTIWSLQIDTPEGKPFIHPLNLPDGRCITDIRPKDHPWHLGLWFCWKYINGVNYWEPGRRRGVKPNGATLVTARDIQLKGDSALVKLDLAYRPRNSKTAAPLLTEKRVISFSAPDTKGSYSVTSEHLFKAEADVVLDRTPPQLPNQKGYSWGGYAGFSLRMSSITKGFQRGASCGESNRGKILKNEFSWVTYTCPKTGHGVKVSVLKSTPQTRYYTCWEDNRYVSPALIYMAPIRLKKGETLSVAYRVTLY